jgi:hypothetical protein
LLELARAQGAEMAQLMRSRRAALEGLSRLLDATAPEELFTGPEDDAIFLYDLLVDTVRARSSSYYWEICRTARRRGVTPEYVVDRAAVLLGTIEERRRTDLYRILGVPALASADVIRQRFLDIAKLHHPDIGGDGALFRRAKEAYEILRDPARRAEYERFWLRALGPFERVAPREDMPLLEAMQASVRSWPRPEPVPPPSPRAPEPAAEPRRDVGIDGVLGALRTMLGPVRLEDLEAARADIARLIGELEATRDHLRALATLKNALGA